MKKIYRTLTSFPVLLFILAVGMPGQQLHASAIISQPKDVTVFEGHASSVFFSVDVNPDVTAKFQWFMKAPGEPEGDPIKEETSPVLEIPFTVLEPATEEKWDGVGYYCLVDDGINDPEESLHAYLWVQPETKPVITGQPRDVTREAGFTGEINYNVELLTGLEAKIIWFRRSPGSVAEWREVGTGPQYTEKVEKLDPRLSGTAYRCMVQHAEGKLWSEVAYLWVKPEKELIVTEPIDVYKPKGYTGYAVWDITPAPIVGITFQWQVRLPGEAIWQNYKGAEKPTFEFPIKEPLDEKLDGMAVRCVARYEKLTEVSEVAYLFAEEVNIYILRDPEDVMKKQGFTGPLYFAIKYDDSYPHLVFQWQERKPGGSWVDISGYYPSDEPELVYLIKEPLTSDWNGWSFRCVVINKDNGDVEYSGAANLYVSLYDTYFLSHPRNVTICEGAKADVKFAVKVVEDITLSLQWQIMPAGEKTWYDIPGADDMILVRSYQSVPLSHNGNAYRCRAVDQYGGTEFSSVAFLYVRGLPVVTAHPVSQEKMVGEAVTFNVTASGYKPFTYQWLKDDAPLPGETAASLSMFPLADTDAGDYSVIVSNVCANPGDTSNAATLTVNAPEFEDGWIEQEIVTSKNLTDIKFTGTNSGWVTVSDSKFIYKTVDGGKNWSQEDVTTSMYWEAVFTTDASHVWIAGEDSIKYSTTGGGTWNGAAMNGIVSAINLYDLYFTDNSNGWAVGDNGLVLGTTDGGATWSELHSGDYVFVTDVNLKAIHMADSDTGFAVGAGGTILRMRNTGAWVFDTPTSGTSSDLKDVHFVDALHGWISGAGGVLLNTVDGGESWSAVSVPVSVSGEDLNGVHFYDSDHGWFITGNGLIVRTNDGGATWYFQESGTAAVLNAVDFADYDNGWVVGNSGTILRTAYSGCLLPQVSLFEDKEFCASVNFTLVADSFANNVDCNYLWSHGDATTGTYNVTESGKYWVRVTSVCGEAVSDTVNVVLYPLPVADAGTDQEICDGDSVQLLASGGVLYSWDNEGLLDEPEIQNPKAGPPVGSTDFIVTVTDENLCENTDTVNITVYPIPEATFTSPAAVCDGDSAAITYTGDASSGANFYWDFDEGSTVTSGESIGPYGVTWDATGNYRIGLLVEENGCSSDTTEAFIRVKPIPLSGFSLPATACGSDLVDITYEGTDSLDAEYVWDFDGGTPTGINEGPYQVSWATGGAKSVTLQVTQESCVSELTLHQITVAYPYEGVEICVVTVDTATEKNLVVWERPADEGIASFNIYRQTATQGVYDSIGNVPYDKLSVFVDMTSQPDKKEHWYKISVVDTCGNESSLSPYHKTVFMQYDAEDGDLNWANYEIESGGIGFASYVIYRGVDSLQLDSIDIVAGGATVYTDSDNPAGLRWYRIGGILSSPCSPAEIGGGKKAGAGPYSQSLSNLDNNKYQATGITDPLALETDLAVYPNPFRDKVGIDYYLHDIASVRIEVYNLLGVRILEVENNLQAPGDYHYDIMGSELGGNSVCYLRFTVGGRTTVKKLIPAR